MKRIYLSILILILATGLFAGSVPEKDAEKVAKSHFYQSIGSIKSLDWKELNLTLKFSPEKNSEYMFYVFDVNDNNGYVVVSSENTIQPILAYSFEGAFNHDNMSPAQKEFLEYYNRSIEYASKNHINVSEKSSNEWRELLDFDPEHKNFTPKTTTPNLLGNIKWNQTWPYNCECPAVSGGSNGHVVVGCVATAMCQVMKYYNWPQTGKDSKISYNYANGGFGNININFAQQNYDWHSIPDVGRNYNEELGKINFHAGVAVSMHWGADGSGSQTENIVTALKSHFRYANSVYALTRQGMTEANWKTKIKAEIDAKRPIVYAGSTTVVGHAWNCDGYQGDDYFHMNWGWGGYGDGYCTVNELISQAVVGGEQDNFNINQRIVIGIYPNSEFSSSCIGSKTITGKEGSFDDGSSNLDYQSNSNCVYVIKPSCGKVIKVNFSNFDLGTGDFVKLYSGDENSTTLIESFDINNNPGNKTITSNSGALTIRFSTDSESNADGWKVSYTVDDCSNNPLVYVEPSGSFEDGSNSCTYSSSLNCFWKIKPNGATKIDINFNNFDLANTSDWVRIYKDSTFISNLLYEFRKTSPPSGTITVNSNTAFIRFFSNSSSNGGNGWDISYTSDGNISLIKDNSLISDSQFYVNPNPGNIDSKIFITLDKNYDARVFVTNLLGEVISDKNMKLSFGTNEIPVYNLVDSNLNNGVYYINIQAEGKISTTKFVVIN